MADLRRESSVRCWERISRWRERLVDLRADGVGSESRRRESCWRSCARWDICFSKGVLCGRGGGIGRCTFSRISLSCSSVRCSSSLGLGSMSFFEANCAYVWKRVSV